MINPPYYVNKEKMDFYPSFPLGMGYIAAYLERKGYAVRRLVRQLRIGAYYSIATPFPGSDLYAYVKEKKLLKFYDIDKCSDEYNINSSDWSAEELKKMVGRELFKLNIKRMIVSCAKNPSIIPVKLYKIISANTGRIFGGMRRGSCCGN